MDLSFVNRIIYIFDQIAKSNWFGWYKKNDTPEFNLHVDIVLIKYRFGGTFFFSKCEKIIKSGAAQRGVTIK